MIEDIRHVMALALKKPYEQTADDQKFTAWISRGAKNLRPTAWAFLAPPQLRTQGRFLSIGRLGRWAEKRLEALDNGKEAHFDEVRNKRCAALPGVEERRAFIHRFAGTAKGVSPVMELLNNKGLERSTLGQCRRLAETLSHEGQVKPTLLKGLKRHITITRRLTRFPLPVSSDMIESLFGRFQHRLERNPQADMNRSALLIPVRCGTLNETTLKRALRHAPQDALKAWEQDNIPYPLRKQRREFFSGDKPKTGKTHARNT